MSTVRRCLIAVMLAVGVLACGASIAAATTFTVTNTNDSGPGSLRDTVANANAGDAILVPAGHYVLASQISITKPLRIIGDGARTTVLDGNLATRLFEIGPMPDDTQVYIASLMLVHGSAPSGGAIDAHGAMILQDDDLRGNVATSGSGGAIFSDAVLDITDSTIVSNQADRNGGALELAPTGATQDFLEADTVANNHAAVFGGAIDLSTTNSERLVLEYNTFYENTLWGTFGHGGSVRVAGSFVTPDSSVLFYGNVFALGAATYSPECDTQFATFENGGGYNAEDGDGGCLNSDPGDRRIGDPKFVSFGNNGGPTDTLMTAADSPLVDVIPVSGGNCSNQGDQRGVQRPNGTPACDIGSVER